MVFNFDKIENTDIGVSPVIPVLFRADSNTNDTKEMSLCRVYLISIKEIMKKHVKKETVLNDLLDLGNKTKPLRKSESIIQKNVTLKLKKVMELFLSRKKEAGVKDNVYEYIIESILLIEGALDIKDNEYLVNLVCTYDYLFKRSGNVVFEKLCGGLKTKIGSRYKTNFNVMNNFPHLSHSQNLLSLSETFSSVKLFRHQVEFIDIVKKEHDKRLVVINASPIGSGKSILQTYTCLHSHYKNLNRFRKRELVVVTCKNKFVIEEIARGCNVENKIGYWFFYNSKLVPSLFCHPITKKGHRFIVPKPKSEHKRNIDEEYEYYLNQYMQVSSNPVYQKTFFLPDVIFCHSDDVFELLDSSFAEKYIKSVVVDEFLIPGFESTLSAIFAKTYIRKYILLSASAPSCLQKIFDLKMLPGFVLDTRDDYVFEYLYDEIIPSFIRCFHSSQDTWVPTMNIRQIEDIQNFSWYHFRFYSPFVVSEMKEFLGSPYDLSEIHDSLSFFSIEEMYKLSKAFLFSLCANRNPEFLERVKLFRPSASVMEHIKGEEKWMIISQHPLETLLSKFGELNCEMANIKDVIEDIAILTEEIMNEKEELLKKQTSLKKSKNLDREEAFMENQELQDELQRLEKKLSQESSYRHNIHASVAKSNSLRVEDLKKMFEELMLGFKNETTVSKIIILAIHGYICVSDVSKHYFKITQQQTFFTKRIFVSKEMCYGTDMNIYGVKLEEDLHVDGTTLVQGLGRAGRNRKHIEVPVFASLSSLKKL